MVRLRSFPRGNRAIPIRPGVSRARRSMALPGIYDGGSRLHAAPAPAVHGVVRWLLIDLALWLTDRSRSRSHDGRRHGCDGAPSIDTQAAAIRGPPLLAKFHVPKDT